MSAPTFLTVFFGAAAALALWIDTRFGGRGPTELSRIVCHGIVAMVLLRVARTGVAFAASPGAMLKTMLVLFAVFLPALVYVFLTSLWILKSLRRALLR